MAAFAILDKVYKMKSQSKPDEKIKIMEKRKIYLYLLKNLENKNR